jgi:hypothetical protein
LRCPKDVSQFSLYMLVDIEIETNFPRGSGETIDATHLKIALCIFLGSKVTEKARFIFGQLANANGAIEKDGMRLFVQVLQELAHALQENTYEEYNSLDKVFEESLVFVRDSEDVEEEQLDGGIRRQWLSQFEFTKLLTASPAPPFFSWLLLWFSLPTFETVVHSVRCSICARKPIVCFRYQCTQCHNYHMCQMCFLKGRSSDHHQISHKVLEFSNKGRGSGHSWHHRLLGLPHRGAGGRVVTEERRPFSFRPSSRASQSNSRNEETDTAMAALTDLMTNSRQINPVMNGERKGSHSPAIIRIGSDGKPAFSSPSKKKSPLPAREVAVSHTLQTSPSRRLSSNASGSSSPDSLSSGGGGPGAKFSFEGTRVSLRGPHQNGKSVGDGERGFKHTSSDSTVGMGTAGKNKDLSKINKRLSMEVDQILMDLSPPPPSTRFSSLPHHGHLRHSFSGGLLPLRRRDDRSLQSNLEGIQKEEKELNVQVSQLTDKREKLSHELHDLISQVQQMQVGFQTLGRGSQTRSWGRLTSPPTYHTRSDSAPIRSPSPTSSSPENSLPPLSEVSPEPAILRKTNKPSERGLDGYRPHVYSPDLGRSSYHSGSKFHDPLAEYHHSTTGPDTPRDTSDHRLSVAW